jgi:hypothetical protein
MIERQIENAILIERTPEDVYDYVTQPWRWHEWHPSSKESHANVDVLSVGDTFDEVIQLQPFMPWFSYTIRKQTRYETLLAQRPVAFEVHGQMNSGALAIHYDFAPAHNNGTRFFRRLNYQVTGPMQILDALFLHSKMRNISRLALSNLKLRLESGEV